jgi:hypothetical protein
MVILLVRSRNVLIRPRLKFRWLAASAHPVLPSLTTMYDAISPPKIGISEARNHHVPVFPAWIAVSVSVAELAFKTYPS